MEMEICRNEKEREIEKKNVKIAASQPQMSLPN